MNKENEIIIKFITIRDVQIKLIDRQLAGEIVPDNVFEVLSNLEKEYKIELQDIKDLEQEKNKKDLEEDYKNKFN